METEGTYILSGIIQGPLPPGPDGRDQLEQFNAKVAASGFTLSLRIDGPNFSLLAADRAIETDAVSASEIEGVLEAAFGSLLEAYPEGMRLSVMSTVRSRVFLGDREHQAVYVVAFPGVIKVESAAVKATLAPRTRRFSWKHKALFAAGALVVLALGFWTSTIWVDYSPAKQQIALMFKGNKLENIRLNSDALGDVVRVEKIDISSLRKVIKLKVSRGAGWENAPAAVDAPANQLQAAIFVRRYLKVTFVDVTGNVVLDRDGKLLERTLRVAGLKTEEVISVEVPLPEGLPIAELIIAP